MAKSSRLSSISNTGFGANSNVEGNRLTNKDGTANLKKTGLPFYERISIYHTLLRMPRGKFLLLIFFFYTFINLLFATGYYAIGVEHLVGTDAAQTRYEKFMDAFFFSAQTLTTVGYGHIAPTGMMMNTLASFESLLGILVFALVTGLFYGRFARPRAYILFSPKMIVAPFKDGMALMIRITTYKNNHLTDVEAALTSVLHMHDEGEKGITRFFQLPLEYNRVNSLALSWTIVHPIDEDSPLYGFTHQDLIDRKFELIVSVKAFDDHFSNIVQQRTSYTHEELEYGARFLPMFGRAESGGYTLLDLEKIGLTEKVALPHSRHKTTTTQDAEPANA